MSVTRQSRVTYAAVAKLRADVFFPGTFLCWSSDWSIPLPKYTFPAATYVNSLVFFGCHAMTSAKSQSTNLVVQCPQPNEPILQIIHK